MPTTVFAFSCHPDDIEFMMGGTLFLLKRAGCALHYMNLADGSCGSTELGPAQTAAQRLLGGRPGPGPRGLGGRGGAAALRGAESHEPLAADLEVFYTPELVRRATAVMR